MWGFLIKLTLADWSHAAGVDIVYTVELRDTGTYGFVLPGTWKKNLWKIRWRIKLFLSSKIESQIKATCEENMEGVRAVYAHVTPSGNCKMCHIDAICSYDDSANAFRYIFTKCFCRKFLWSNRDLFNYYAGGWSLSRPEVVKSILWETIFFSIDFICVRFYPQLNFFDCYFNRNILWKFFTMKTFF